MEVKKEFSVELSAKDVINAVLKKMEVGGEVALTAIIFDKTEKVYKTKTIFGTFLMLGIANGCAKFVNTAAKAFVTKMVESILSEKEEKKEESEPTADCENTSEWAASYNEDPGEEA